MALSVAADESFGDLSFPEASPELLAELCRDKELGTSTTASAPELVLPTPPTQIDIDDDESLWAAFQEPSISDLIKLEPNPLPSPPVSGPKPIFVPLYRIGLSLADLDIEDYYPEMAKTHEPYPILRIFDTKRSFSVSSVVHALWCEYKAKYDLIGFKHRPVEQRPDVIKVEKTVIEDNKEVVKKVSIRVDKEVARVIEKQAIQGTAIHKRLEREVFPETIPVRIETQEDFWGLRLINMISGIKMLTKEAVTREMIVFGFMDGVPIVGIIDELELQPAPQEVTNGNILTINDHKTKHSSRPVLSVSRQHQAQLMIYKVLLEGLLSPDFDWPRFFNYWGLDPARAFNGHFQNQISEVIVGNELDLSLLDATTLEDLRDGWMKAVPTLNLVNGPVDSELTIVYRSSRNGSVSAGSSSTSDESDIIDIKSFKYDEGFLKQILKESLEFWLAQRPLKGVRLDEIWKCESCEYNEDCEWREDQAALFSKKKQA